MNTRGIALAADSAVTLGECEKIYHNAEKLLQLAPSAPVGIMTFGSADLMDVPWETVVAGYQKHLGDRHYDTLSEYLEDFVSFIETSTTMFPDALQLARFASIARGLWNGFYAQPWQEKLREHGDRDDGDPQEVLRRLIAEDHADWEKYASSTREVDSARGNTNVNGQLLNASVQRLARIVLAAMSVNVLGISRGATANGWSML